MWLRLRLSYAPSSGAGYGDGKLRSPYGCDSETGVKRGLRRVLRQAVSADRTVLVECIRYTGSAFSDEEGVILIFC